MGAALKMSQCCGNRVAFQTLPVHEQCMWGRPFDIHNDLILVRGERLGSSEVAQHLQREMFRREGE